MGSREKKIITDILQKLSLNKRLFRINSGMGWTGKIVLHDTQKIILKNPRPLHGAPTGWPDLVGWETIEITQEMVGKKIAVFCAEEVKATGKLSPEQKNFKRLLEKMGGIFKIKKKTESN